MTYQQKMTELGLTDEMLSVKMKQEIASISEGITNATSALANAQSDEARAEIQSDIDEMNDELIKKIVKFHKNKDVYAANAARLKEAAAAKKAKKDGVTPPATPTPTPVVATPAPTPEEQAAAGGEVAAAGGEEKKGGIFGKVILTGVAVALSIAGINYFGKK